MEKYTEILNEKELWSYIIFVGLFAFFFFFVIILLIICLFS